MENAVKKQEEISTELVQHNATASYFEDYGEQVTQRNIVGRLLKFSKGDWLVGQDEEEFEDGTRLVMMVDEMLIGWIKWVDNAPDDQIMGQLAKGFSPPRRDTLGDHDETMWELDNEGRPRDPWQRSNSILLRTVGLKGPADETTDIFTFATSSKGGIQALGEVCKAYGKRMRLSPGEYPVIELKTNKYKHSNPQFGWIKVPVFAVVGWEKAKLPEAQATPPPPAPKPAAAAASKPAAAAGKRK